MGWSWRTLVVMVALLAVVGVAGCGAVAEKAVEQATGVDVDQDKDSVTVTTDDGDATISSGGKLPAGFPSDVPVYSPSEVQTSMTFEDPTGTRHTATLTTSDSVSDVMTWYADEFGQGGYKTVSTFETGDSGSIIGEKGSTQVAVYVSMSGSDTTISLTVGPK